MIEEIPREAGTYTLVIRLREHLVTSLNEREILLTGGLYVYTGSAFGPGGLSARISRHLRRRKPHHWHIDELTSLLHCRIVALIFCISPEKLEGAISSLFSKDVRFAGINGFGSSDDSKNPSHLFLSRSDLLSCVASSAEKYAQAIGSMFQSHGVWIRNLVG